MRITLGEGNTPLLESVQVAPSLGLRKLYFKLETTNPTGSYKDRFIAAEMARLLKAGATSCVATSSGNTGAALAAYSARFGVKCTIVVDEKTPSGKLIQMQAHGARVLRVKNFLADPAVTSKGLDILKSSGIPLVVSAYRYCPEGMMGVESMGREVLAQAPKRVRHIFVPVGGGGLFVATVRGTQASVRVHAVQPEGCSTVVAAVQRGDSDIVPIQSTTRISGLSVPYDIDGSMALHELRRCGGSGYLVSDAEVLDARRELLEKEGIFCEPAGATALAGLRRALQKGAVNADEDIVCLVTGNGFKDPESLAGLAETHPAMSLEIGQLKEAVLHAKAL